MDENDFLFSFSFRRYLTKNRYREYVVFEMIHSILLFVVKVFEYKVVSGTCINMLLTCLNYICVGLQYVYINAA